MPLDFPSSPTANQIYGNYYWDATNQRWALLSDSLELRADFSNTATGTYTSGGVSYKYVSFTSSGTLTVTRGGYADVLVVGGGGGGNTAGGGAGGVLYVENAFLPVGSLGVVVGAGGLGVNANAHSAQSGNSSQLGPYVSPGGGAGGGMFGFNTTANGGNGGSGGGGGTVAGLGLLGLGNNGGAGGSANSTGGGGGAGAPGGAASGTVGGAGGAGIAISITGSSVFYGGGGGGGSGSTGGAGLGGIGGGGNAAISGNAQGGTANTGGGGGAAWSGGTAPNIGGAGGSGIVIVRVRTS